MIKALNWMGTQLIFTQQSRAIYTACIVWTNVPLLIFLKFGGKAFPRVTMLPEVISALTDQLQTS